MQTQSFEIPIINMPSKQTENICITFVQRRPNVFNVGPAFYKCYTNVLCLLGLNVENMDSLVFVK